MGVIAAHGIEKRWPDVQLCGVLHRIAWCYLFGSLIFCHLRVRAIGVLAVALLVGYWGLMTFVPFPNVPLQESKSHPPGPGEKFPDLSAEFDRAEKITGKYEKGLNLCNYLDARYMPGRKYTGYYSPEGLLSTMPAVASCLLGVLAGCLIRSSRSDRFKILWLLSLGLAGVLLGFAWGQQFPVIKKIWTSSFVLVAGGYSAILLAVFYLVIDVWKWRWWCVPLVWIGTNALTAYMVRNLFHMDEVALRLTGGDLSWALNRWVYPGTGPLLTAVVALLLIWWLTWFLYRNKIFIRL
jgi:predicted acyltransferase